MIFYQTIIETLRFKNIRALIKKTITELGSQPALAKLQELAGSEPLGKALWLLGYQKTRSGQLTLFQDDDTEDAHHQLLERYFYSQNTKSDLKRLGLSRSIDSIQARFQLLSAIFQCLIGFGDLEEVSDHTRIILWVDNIEDLIRYLSQYYHPFIQGLQKLVDHLPHYFTLLINFTLAPYQSQGDIRMGLGRELADRITRQINFLEPIEDEAFAYVKDLMRQYRTEGFVQSGLSATYPFKEDALRVLIANLPSCTPRHINQFCAYIIEEALDQGTIHNVGEGSVDTQFVRSAMANAAGLA